MNEQQKQTMLDLPKVIAVGISSPVATILTSRFGVTGTLMGLALTAVILTMLADILKVYLARAPATVAKMPGGFASRLFRWNVRGRLRVAFARSSSLSPAPARWRFVLIGSVVAAGISLLVALSIVTVLELGAGKSLSCWVWNECPAESSASGDGEYASVSTQPSIFGGGQEASSAASTVRSSSPRQITTYNPGPSSQLESVPGSEQHKSPQPGQRKSPSGTREAVEQRSSPSSGIPQEDEHRSPAERSDEAWQQEDQSNESAPNSEQPSQWWSTPDTAKAEAQQPSAYGGPEENKQRSPDDRSEGAQQQEDQRNQPSSGQIGKLGN